MTRRKEVPQSLIGQLVENLGLTSILAIGVSTYDKLHDLPGVSFDLDSIEDIFKNNKDTSLYKDNKLIMLENPNSAEFRRVITDYSFDRSARGDILIFYFSGHGAVLSDGSFAFCLSDTVLGYEGNGVLPISVVRFNDVAVTLASVDVHPVFIIDACFGGLTAPRGYANIESTMQAEINSIAPESYVLLAAASPMSSAIDTPSGGGFTQALNKVVIEGLTDEEGRQFPFLSIDQLVKPLQDELVKAGLPLPKSHIGRYFPLFAFSRNPKFKPDTESFTPYMKRIVEHLWNAGKPKQIQIAELGKDLGYTEYANHRKLSLKPWQLLEDGDAPKTRKLSARGIRFAKGELSIPKVIIRDPITWEWVPAPGSNRVDISSV